MSKIGRFLGNVKAFASEALGTERTIFGSTAQSNALTDQINALYRRGWAGVSATETPTYQDFNALGYTLGQFIAYLHQMGIAEYHAQQEYYKGTVVIFDGNLYQAVKDSPSGQPAANSANWYSFKSAIDSKADTTSVNSALATKASTTYVDQQIATRGTAATRDVGESAGNVMEVGAFGLGANAPTTTNHLNAITTFMRDNGSATYNVPTGFNYGSIISVPYDADYNQSLSLSLNGRLFYTWREGANEPSEHVELCTTGNILSSTGQSTGFPMSQKAVTDAITNSAIGAGQTWQDKTEERVKGFNYTNTTGRSIMVTVSIEGLDHLTSFTVNGISVYWSVAGAAIGIASTHTTIIPPGGTYSCSDFDTWLELR